MESDCSSTSNSSFEFLDYDSSKIYIYEKEFRDYVVYFSANGDSPTSTYKSFEHSFFESTGIALVSSLTDISVDFHG